MSSTNRRQSPRKAAAKAKANRPATAADYAALTFKPVKSDLKEAGASLTAWLDRAKDEYVLFRYAAAALEKGDVELAAFVEATGAEAALELYDQFVELEERYKTGVKVLSVMQTRIVASLSRVHCAGGPA
jgi:hypothetical protein